MLGLFAIAPALFIDVLGSGTAKWSAAITPFEILCVYGMQRITLEPATSLLLGQGNAKALMIYRATVTLLTAVTVYPSFVIGGLPAVAAAMTLTMLVGGALVILKVRIAAHLSALEHLKAMWAPAVSAGLMAAILILLQAYYPYGKPSVVALIPLGGILYLGFVFGIGRGRTWNALKAAISALVREPVRHDPRS
jgi:O-antigen/teichoic acid export membrane protein